MLGLVRTGNDNRLWATGADGKPFRISPQQLVWETDIAVSDDALPAWLAEAEALSAELGRRRRLGPGRRGRARPLA